MNEQQQQEFLSNIDNVNIPFSVAQEVVEDILELLHGQGLKEADLTEIEKNKDYLQALVLVAQKDIIYAALMLSINKSVDFVKIKNDLLLPVIDPLSARIRKEIIGRALQTNKDLLEVTGISVTLVKQRMNLVLEA